ncbi:barstar family protein [Geodermatophilus nigrescens]
MPDAWRRSPVSSTSSNAPLSSRITSANWDALDECVCDLKWLPASSYRIVIEAAPRLLDRDQAERPTFLNLMSDAGMAWASASPG